MGTHEATEHAMTEPKTIWKVHGTGNDFVMVEDLEDARPLSAELVAALCDRHTGVGADGVIRVAPGQNPGEAFFMDYRNSDGSLAEMCGNGIRCLGKLVFEHGLTTETELEVGSRAGTKHLSLDLADGVVRTVTVGMGPPAFARGEIPMQGPASEPFLTEAFEVYGQSFKASAVSMGNPHLVLFVERDDGVRPGRVRRAGRRERGGPGSRPSRGPVPRRDGDRRPHARAGVPDRPGRARLPGRDRRRVARRARAHLVRIAKRVEALPPYLFAELDK